MLVIGQALTNSAVIPILVGGMTCCRSARPDDVPILSGRASPFPHAFSPLAGARPAGIRAALPSGLSEFRTR